MEVSELFVSLGVKNSEKTINVLTQVKTGMSGIASTSLEAKAAIIGAMYALEQLMAQSAGRGTELSNFSALTGVSIKQLQMWEYAARQAGESNEDFAGSLKSVQDKIAQMKIGKGTPEGLGLVQQTVGFDVSKAYNSPFYVLAQLQKFAQSNKVPIDVQNQVLAGFGISPTLIAAMRKNVFTESNFKRAPLYSDKEVDQLNKVNVLWSNLQTKIQMQSGHFYAKDGPFIVKTISQMVDQIFKLTVALTHLAKELHVFDFLKFTLKEITNLFEEFSRAIQHSSINATKLGSDLTTVEKIVKTITDAVHGWEIIFAAMDKVSIDKPGAQPTKPNDSTKNNPWIVPNPLLYYKEDQNDFLTKLFSGIFKIFYGIKSTATEKFPTSAYPKLNGTPDLKQVIPPKINPNSNSETNNHNTTINQSLNFQHEGKEHAKIKDSMQKSVNEAWRQTYAQSQAT